MTAIPLLMFMAQPPAEVLQVMWQVLVQKGWDRELGSRMFNANNWHQSLSHPLVSDNALRDRMLQLGSSIEAAAFTMLLNRLRGTSGPDNAIHWAFHAHGRPKAFAALVAAIRSGLQEQGLEGMPGHSPHVTISYAAPHKLVSTEIRPIAWRIDEILLVESRGSGADYHYHTLGRWPLRRAPPGPESQRELW